MNEKLQPPSATTDAPQDALREPTDALPAYEPPRLVKKRSVARATLVTGTGPVMGGLVTQG